MNFTKIYTVLLSWIVSIALLWVIVTYAKAIVLFLVSVMTFMAVAQIVIYGVAFIGLQFSKRESKLKESTGEENLPESE